MFESFKTICYFPLIVFAIGWVIGEITYFKNKSRINIPADQRSQFLDGVRKSNTNSLLTGLLYVIFLLAGIYLGSYFRWFFLAVGIVVMMFSVAKAGSIIEYSVKKNPFGDRACITLVVTPYLVCLGCSLLAVIWMVYVFVVAGL